MSNISLKFDEQDMKRLNKAFRKSPDLAKKACVAATNRAIATANTELQRNITQRYNMKKGNLSGGSAYKGERSNNLIKVKKANFGNPNASINVRGSYLTLYRFISGKQPRRNKKGKMTGYVSVKVLKGGAKKMSRYNFVQTIKGGTQIAQRHSGSRQISRVLKTISVAHMASHESVITKTQEKGQEMLQKRINHELDRRFKNL